MYDNISTVRTFGVFTKKAQVVRTVKEGLIF